MNTLLLQRALDQVGIPSDELDPQIIISNRFSNGKSTWVVFFAAATSQAFELPGKVDIQTVMTVAETLVRWDVAMMENEPMSGDTVRTVKWAGAEMMSCGLKELIESAHGKS